jgi:acyl-CoA thioesterase
VGRASDSRPTSATHDLLGLSPTTELERWQVVVHPSMQTGSGALHGGSAFGATIEAMVAATGRPAIWTTVQYVAHARAGDTLDLVIDAPAAGHRVTQARATLRHQDDEVLTAVGAFGSREFAVEHTWPSAPDVPCPRDCEPRSVRHENIVKFWQSRIASGRSAAQLDGLPGSGRSASWYRLPQGPRMVTAGDLAVIGDFTMLELHDALGSVVGANSLDNTLRVGTLHECEWVLVDAEVSMVARGFASVAAHLWSEAGDLLALASQTLVLRNAGPDGFPIRSAKRFAGASD